LHATAHLGLVGLLGTEEEPGKEADEAGACDRDYYFRSRNWEVTSFRLSNL